tara:strand:- start:219 stop:998 length:780 start_codon:yes stop_codon:yes gene_type:complete
MHHNNRVIVVGMHVNHVVTLSISVKHPTGLFKLLDNLSAANHQHHLPSWQQELCAIYTPDRLSSIKNVHCAHRSILTFTRNRRIVRPIGGNKPPWGRRNPLFLTVSRHVSCGYFCARIPGASSRLGREGGEYKTLRGNKPACLRTGFEPPATSAVVESLSGGVVKRYPEGFDMTDKLISFDQIETAEHAAMLLNQLYDSLEGIALLIEAGHNEQAASIARMGMTACVMVTPPIENTIAELDGPIDTSPRQPVAWPEQGE